MKIGFVKDSENSSLFEFIASRPESSSSSVTWSAASIENFQDFDLFFIPSKDSESILKKFTSVSSTVNLFGVCDLVFRQNGRLWPDNFLSEALKRKLIEKEPGLDTRALAYVAGSGPWAETALRVLIHAGFSKINWVTEEPKDVQKAARHLQSKYFGIDLRLMKNSDLTLQPSNGSVLVNTLAANSSEQFRQDLAYLNFIQRPGLIVDFWIEPLENQLLEESNHVGLQTLDGVDLALEYASVIREEIQQKMGVSPFGGALSREDFISFLKTRPLSR